MLISLTRPPNPVPRMMPTSGLKLPARLRILVVVDAICSDIFQNELVELILFFSETHFYGKNVDVERFSQLPDRLIPESHEILFCCDKNFISSAKTVVISFNVREVFHAELMMVGELEMPHFSGVFFQVV